MKAKKETLLKTDAQVVIDFAVRVATAKARAQAFDEIRAIIEAERTIAFARHMGRSPADDHLVSVLAAIDARSK